MQTKSSALLTLACLGGSTAFAQSILRSATYSTVNGAGYAVCGVGDVNGDSVPDFIVGAPTDDSHGTDAGAVVVYSGANGSMLHLYAGAHAGDRLGSSIVDLGDVNNDGRSDFAIGAPGGYYNDIHPGYVIKINGATGLYLNIYHGTNDGDEFGASLAAKINIDGNASTELLIGAPGENSGGANAGGMYLIDLATAAVKMHLVGDPGDRYGECVANIGDIEDDGDLDFAVAAPGYNGGRGAVYVYNGTAGSYMTWFQGVQAGEHFGRAMCGIDVNSDAANELAIGSPDFDFGGTDVGRVRIYRATNNTLLATFSGGAANDHFGTSVADVADVDADGFRDIAVGSPAGYVWVARTSTGQTIYTLRGEQPGDGFGTSVANAGDLDQDLRYDILVGAPNFTAGAAIGCGLGRVFSADWIAPQAYCTAKVNSLGCTPQISATGKPSYAAPQGFSLSATNVLSQKMGMLLYGTQSAANPFYGGTLCITGATRTLLSSSHGNTHNTDCSGVLSFDFDALVQSHLDPRLTPGRTVYAQFWYRDAASTGGIGLSDAMSFAIAP